jgi:pyruvate dehydrogenase E2 component (dihydrolipoamide acetyltransferase)
MAEYVIMPKLGFNMDKGQLVKWHKKEGELVEKGEVLFEVLTDKTNMEIEATCSGIVLKLLVEEGKTVPIAQPIAIIGEAGEDISGMVKEAKAKLGRITTEADKPKEAEPEREEPKAPPQPEEGIKLTPRARRYIKDRQIDITQLTGIKGTGYNGGITEQDIENYLKQKEVKLTPLAQKIAKIEGIDTSTLKGTGIGGKVVKADIEPLLSKGQKEHLPEKTANGKEILNTIPYTGMRKVIGDRLSQSKFTAPHIYFTTSVDMTNLLSLREQVNQKQPQKISVTDFIVAAAAKALQRYPALNSSLQGDRIEQYKNINIGIAVALEDGLIVPVIRNVQAKKISQIAEESQALIEKARTGKLMPEEYKGGTFTVSNLGMFGIENFTAIINPPETAILGISSTIKKPVVVTEDGKDKIVVRPMMNMTVSVDHRLIDGLTATRFINEIKAHLEDPVRILI